MQTLNPESRLPTPGTIVVNGEAMEWRPGMTVADILKIRNYIFRMLVVQVNGELVKRGTYDKAVVPDEANVEVIHMISGG
ncbi:MAG TPA: sulfur carrier protein ThiS [Vicinamibacterales bacterium]|nr:sulfur carrier protein ThiS [Vicinamibacterales bacterium]